ncbi:MAG: hypothetical protein ACH350_00115 [Parachlamydiaceae bacterium]
MSQIQSYSDSDESINALANANRSLEESPIKETDHSDQGADVIGLHTTTHEEEKNIEDILSNNAALQTLFDSLARMGSHDEQSKTDVFSMNTLLRSLMDLTQTLQSMSAIYANKLVKITDKVNAYSDMMNDIDYVSETDYKGYSGNRDNNNQRLAGMTEKARINKDKQSGYAQSATTSLQSLKDASSSLEDMISSQCELVRGISQKIK